MFLNPEDREQYTAHLADQSPPGKSHKAHAEAKGKQGVSGDVDHHRSSGDPHLRVGIAQGPDAAGQCIPQGAEYIAHQLDGQIFPRKHIDLPMCAQGGQEWGHAQKSQDRNTGTDQNRADEPRQKIPVPQGLILKMPGQQDGGRNGKQGLNCGEQTQHWSEQT